MKIKINQSSHVELQLSLVTDTQSLQSSLADQAANISLQLSEEEHSESVVILKSYKNLGCIINAQKSCSSPRISSKQVNSLVVGADVYQDSQEERREYIALYKRTLNAMWLPALNSKEKARLNELEEYLG